MRAIQTERARVLEAALLGIALFCFGLILARRVLPEWQVGPMPPEQVFEQRYRETAVRLGLRLTPGPLQSRIDVPPQADTSFVPLPKERVPLAVEVVHPAWRGDDPGSERPLNLSFDPEGHPFSIAWVDLSRTFEAADEEADRRLVERMVAVLVKPGESLGPVATRQFGPTVTEIRPILRGDRTVGTLELQRSNSFIEGAREPGVPLESPRKARWLDAVLPVGLFLLVCGLFFYLAVNRQISVTNAGLLAALVIAASDWPALLDSGFWFLSLIPAFWLFLLWSVGESLMRSVDPDSTTGLDAVRTGRLGRRAGRALLQGFGYGAGLAGLAFALQALPLVVPGAWLENVPLEIPPLPPGGQVFSEGFQRAAGVTLMLALASRFLPARWVWPASGLAAGLLFSPFELVPWWLNLVAGLVFTGTLARVGHRLGLTALLTASLVLDLLPAAVFSLFHLGWMPVSGSFLVLTTLWIVGSGLVALSRAAEIEESVVKPPAFVRRLAEERRYQYELDLLARIQRGLLPEELPEVEGYDFAARSLLASEAGGDLYDFYRDPEGGLWIAAGDVAGHGYSCAVSQAMTKAALASLIPDHTSPAEVLGEIHRVLRQAGPQRSFTTLALLRLKPETGEVVLSNAGHPSPFLVEGREVCELALPALPLGQPLPSTYREKRFTLPPGGTLLLFSDGLFEARDLEGNLFNLERLRQILELGRSRTAAEILDTVLLDWHRHQGEGPPADDTTVVVIHRNDAVASS